MKPETSPSFSTPPRPGPDFPSRSESPPARVSGLSRISPASFGEARTADLPTGDNPFFSRSRSDDAREESSGLSPLGIDPSSLPSSRSPKGSWPLRLLSFVVKTSLLGLLILVGWYGYSEYIDNSESGARVQAALPSGTVLKQPGKKVSAPQSRITAVSPKRAPSHLETQAAFTGNAPSPRQVAVPNFQKPVGQTIIHTPPVRSNISGGKAKTSIPDLRRQIADSKGKNISNLYLKLSDQLGSFGAKKDAENVLREGLKKDPSNPELTLALADSLMAQDHREDAWVLLAKSTRTGDLRFASRLLVLGLDTGKYVETLVLLDPEAADRPEWKNDDWVIIALLYEKTGATDHALELLKKYDLGKTQTRRIIAQREQRSKDARAKNPTP